MTFYPFFSAVFGPFRPAPAGPFLPGTNKASVFKRFKELYCAQSGYSFIGFWLFRFQPLHKPAVLLWCQCPDFILGSRPLETAAFQTFVQQKESVAFPIQRLNPVSLSAAEQKQCCLEWIHPKLCAYHAGQAINPAPQIRITAGNVHWAIAVEVIQHERRVSTRAFSNSGCTPA